MTRFTVVWHSDVKNELAELWMAASDRRALSAAADRLDRELAVDPQRKGRPVGDQLRVLTEPPLEILFDVSEPDRLVKIVAVASIEP